MTYSAKSVRKALRRCGLNYNGTSKGKRHECWTDEDGRTVELAVRGTEIPPTFLKITTEEMESKGICSRAEFKKLVRSV